MIAQNPFPASGSSTFSPLNSFALISRYVFLFLSSSHSGKAAFQRSGGASLFVHTVFP